MEIFKLALFLNEATINTNCSWLLDTTWFLLWAKVGILSTTLTIWVLAITPSWLPYEKDKYSGSNSQCGNWSNHCTNNNPFGTWKTWEEQHINICLQKLYVWDPPPNHFSHDAFFYAYNFFYSIYVKLLKSLIKCEFDNHRKKSNLVWELNYRHSTSTLPLLTLYDVSETIRITSRQNIWKFLCIHCTTANKSFFYLLVEVAILWFKQSVYSTYVHVEVFSQSFLYYIRAAWFVRIKYNVMYDGSWFQLFYFLSKFFTIIIQVFLFHGNMSNYHLLLGKVDVKVRQKEMLTTSVRRPIVLATFACGSKKICNSSTEKCTGWFLLDEILCPFFLKEYRSSSLAGLVKKQRPCVIVYAIVLLVCFIS